MEKTSGLVAGPAYQKVSVSQKRTNLLPSVLRRCSLRRKTMISLNTRLLEKELNCSSENGPQIINEKES